MKKFILAIITMIFAAGAVLGFSACGERSQTSNKIHSDALPAFLFGTVFMTLMRNMTSSHIAIICDKDEINKLLDYFGGVNFVEGTIDWETVDGTKGDSARRMVVDLVTYRYNFIISMYVHSDNSISMIFNDVYYMTEPGAISEEFREYVYEVHCPW